MRFVPFKLCHIAELDVQESQRGAIDCEALGLIANVAELSDAWTGLDETGEVIGCAGVMPTHIVSCTNVAGLECPKEAVVWAVFSPSLKANVKAVIRFVRTVLDHRPEQRILAYVEPSQPKAARFAEAVGLACAGEDFADGRRMLVFALERGEWPIRSPQPSLWPLLL